MDDHYATMMESFVITSSLPVAHINTENISGLDQVVLLMKWVISLKKVLHKTLCTTQHGINTPILSIVVQDKQ